MPKTIFRGIQVFKGISNVSSKQPYFVVSLNKC